MTSKRWLLSFQNGGTGTYGVRLTKQMKHCYMKTNTERCSANSRTNDSWWPFRAAGVDTQTRHTSHADIHRSRQIGRERGGHYDYCMWWCCYFFDATPSRSLDNITNHFLPRFVSLSLTIVSSGGRHQTQNLPRDFPVSWFVCGNHTLREEILVVCPPWAILFW